MAEKTNIEWCDHTFNPWWGCVKVSEGCANCYAEVISVNRRGLHVWGAGADRKIAKTIWRDPIKWNREAEKAGKRHVVFCMSMGDFFEDRPDLIEPRMRTFDLIEQTPWLYWLLLTKRPENMLTMVPESWRDAWPENTMALTSIENQKRADTRIPQLLQVPARRGLSIEPLLDSISDLDLKDIDWVIVGGESQKGARPMHPAWARSILEKCQAAGIPYFFKQWGEWLHDSQIGSTCNASKATEHRWPDGSISYRVGKKNAGSKLDGKTWKEMPLDYIRKKAAAYQLLPRLKPEEFSALEKDIVERGIMVPVEVDQDGEILDGHHRVQIAEKHGLKYETVIRDFGSEDAKKEHVLKLNLLRRHLPPYEWGLAFKQLATIRTNGRIGGKGGRPGENEVTVSALAEECGASPRTARRRVMQAEDYLSLPVEAKQAVDVGRTTMAQAKRDREESSCQKKQKRCFLHEDKGTGPYDDDKYDVCETCADKIKELGLAKVQLRCTDNTFVLIDAAIDLK